ncbi:Phosphoenolpyruvate phosphomutase [Frankia sp. Allo2]|uniref:isocitrate lyase/phosphoenolpyruvate mutase family protein n=1 Tax=Frankia sp. Allo2 TaxID=981405 RepID=UPI0004DCCCD7|nr:Phosphoenolpyruvate phosphomutase [Frankia sp. Allo2]
MTLDWFSTDTPVRLGLGVHDGLSACVTDKQNIDFVWVSSFCVSAVLGLPDLGLVDSSEMASVVRTVVRATRYPVVVDMDSGYGGPAQGRPGGADNLPGRRERGVHRGQHAGQVVDPVPR